MRVTITIETPGLSGLAHALTALGHDVHEVRRRPEFRVLLTAYERREFVSDGLTTATIRIEEAR
jgi:hypothetical protein